MTKSKLIQVRLTEEEKDLVNLLVQKNYYFTASDAVADGIRQLAAKRRLKALPRPRPRPAPEKKQRTLFSKEKPVE